MSKRKFVPIGNNTYIVPLRRSAITGRYITENLDDKNNLDKERENKN